MDIIYWIKIYFIVGSITLGLFYLGILLHKIFHKNVGVSYNPLSVFIGFILSVLVWPFTLFLIGYSMMQDERKILSLSREIGKYKYEEEVK